MDQPRAPAALEEDVERGACDARDAPRLLRHDRAQQPLGERAVASRDHGVEPREEPRLVGGGDTRREQAAADDEAAHARRPPDGDETGVADDGVHGFGGDVVRAADHRGEAGADSRASPGRGRSGPSGGRMHPNHGDQGGGGGAARPHR